MTRDMIENVDEAEQPTELRLHLEKIVAVPPQRVFAAFDAEQLRHTVARLELHRDGWTETLERLGRFLA
jgi:hypothetical protein